MKTLTREKANTKWLEWWDEMQSEWFKVELLQDYYGEDSGPSLDSWLNGDRQKSIRFMQGSVNESWRNRCHKKLAQGVKLLRIHILEEPYTPYIEWEIKHYRRINIPIYGEQVYLINRLELSSIDLPVGDLMIFDKKRVVVNQYDKNGRMTHQTFYSEKDNIDGFMNIKKVLITHPNIQQI